MSNLCTYLRLCSPLSSPLAACGEGHRPRRARGRGWRATCVAPCDGARMRAVVRGDSCDALPTPEQCDAWVASRLAAGARVVRETRRARIAACEYERGHYQRTIITGLSAMSGADLRGRAKSYAGRYAASRANLLGRIDDDACDYGVSAYVARGLRGRRVLVIRDEWARWGGRSCVDAMPVWVAPPVGHASAAVHECNQRRDRALVRAWRVVREVLTHEGEVVYATAGWASTPERREAWLDRERTIARALALVTGA